jgi:ribosome maturation factor RimP
MALADKEQAILDRLEQAAPDRGLDIVSVEVTGPAKRPVVRVRIDTLSGSPIDMQKVVDETPWVSSIVEELDPFPDAYDLEVSSPGIDRPLRRARDFERFAGERAEVVLQVEAQGRKKGTGVIRGVSGETVTLEIDGSPWQFLVSEVRTARLKPDYDRIFAQAKGGKSRQDFAEGDQDPDGNDFEGADGTPDQEQEPGE